MGEWKRVFGNPKRLTLVALLTLLCLGAFLFSQPEAIRPGEFERIAMCSQYADLLTERWRDLPLEALPGEVEKEFARRENFDIWCDTVYGGFDYAETLPFESEAEAFASVADIPSLAESHGENSFALYAPLLELREEVNYLTGYADYLDGIQTQAANQSAISLFGGGFSRRNLQKTRLDFAGLQGVAVSFGNSRGIQKWLDFDLGNYFHLFGILLLAMALLEERKKGLWSVVRTCKNGRIRLGIHRLGILTAASVLCTVLLCGLPLLLSLGIYGGFGDFDRAIQSIPAFKTCTLPVTVGGWLAQYFLVKAAAGVMIGLLLWCLLSSLTDPQSFLLVLGAVLVGEFALYEALPVQSAFNVVKYLNIFSYVHTGVMYTEYLNVDLLGYPVGIRDLLLLALPVFCLLLTVWTLALQAFRRPEGNRDHIGAARLVWNRLADKLRIHMSLISWESYKALALQKGVIVLLAAALVGLNLNFTAAIAPRNPNEWYEKYLNDMAGPVNETTDAYFTRARTYAQSADNSANLLSALDTLSKEVDELRDRAADKGFTPWLLNSKPFDSVYGRDSQYLQRGNAAIAILLVAFCCAGLGAQERQAGTVSLLRSLKRGRRGLFTRKMLLASASAVFVWAAVYMRELWLFLAVCAPETLSAPVQNLQVLAAFPVIVTIREFLWLVYALRLLMLIATGWVALLVSGFAPGTRTAYVACVGVLGVPSLLFSFGIEALKWVCPVLPVASAELTLSIRDGNCASALPWLLWLAAGIAALLAARDRWIKAYFSLSAKG